MANFKRGKCRSNALRAIRGSQASWRARYGFKPVKLDHHVSYQSAEWRAQWRAPGNVPYSMMASVPAWWDRTFHTRPKRVAEKRLLYKVKADLVDPDDTPWPLGNRRPTQYYW